MFFLFSQGIDANLTLALPEVLLTVRYQVLFTVRNQVGIPSHSCCCILKLLFNQQI